MTRLFHHLIESLRMNHGTKNKLLTWLVLLLLVANAATIAMFWLSRAKQPPLPKGTPRDFLVKELKLDVKQREQLDVLVKEHRQAAEQLRIKVKESKESLFGLLKQPNVTDSTKQHAAKAVSVITEELDLLTLDHFQKVRALCNSEQQKKFDDIISQLTTMMGQPRHPMDRQGPPPGGPEENRLPPPAQ